MAKTIGYSVISDLKDGFLHHSSPSVWHFDISTAVRYETEKEAWAAANRRKSSLALPVRVIEDESGKLDYERLRPIAKAVGGSWIVLVRLEGSPAITHYVTSAGKRISISNVRLDAKGFLSEKAAQGAADLVNTIKGWSAQIERVTAEIVAFPS
ncbi:hypothetical protein [Stutzerimonas stutzeri]|uniref:hypothetical protein n=1 Tax=Stutzerimonas stutzeri TaxID=316 RepID=UPI0003969A98|nr:hypothetical protein [Stutzerimonas stutzeri]EQM80913.1 hypothetical protein L686_08625 [Stutzerimonas stutzeri MF28]